MPNTYTQIHLQFVFAVKCRNSLITADWEDELYKYITAIVENNNHKLICINGMPDHIHKLIGMRPTQSVSDLLQDIKANLSKWINEKKFTNQKFQWQEGFGAFSYSKSHLNNVINYIQNQKQHHKQKTFREEYLEFLQKFEIEYDEKYVFHELL